MENPHLSPISKGYAQALIDIANGKRWNRLDAVRYHYTTVLRLCPDPGYRLGCIRALRENGLWH